jgi:3-oxoadipate enol-lactonase
MSAETHTIQTDDGVSLHVVTDGPAEAPPVLLCNSLGTDLTMWDSMAAHLRGRVRLIRYDKRGHGRSSPPPETESSIARLGRDAVAVLDGLGVQRARYCGLSIGGMIGMWLGANAPDRFSSLVLCNTSAHVGHPEMWNARIATVRDGGMAAVVDGVVERWFTPAFRSGPNPEVDKVRAMLLATSAAGYMACSAAVRDVDERADLARIGVPALVIAGADDPALPPAMGEAIAAGIAGARYHCIAGAAHLSNIEQPEEFNAVVGQFLLQDGRT